MNQSRSRNPGHSVFQRLLNRARSHGEDFNLLLVRYGVERFLYRLGISRYADRFFLKGANLFLVWKGRSYRVSKDVDLLGSDPEDVDRITGVFRELCQVAAVDVDGIEFVPDTVRAEEIRGAQGDVGIRVTLVGILHQARIHLQVDIGFGDPVTPWAERIMFPTLLDAPPPQLLACPRYTMVAEKAEAMARLGLANSRMKDFYDLWLLSQLFEFEGLTLCEAIQNSFSGRSTPLPSGRPVALTDDFRKDAQKQTQWRAFVRRSKAEKAPGDIDVVIGDVAALLMPVLEAAQRGEPFELFWPQGGPWADASQR
jgi:hypothetical protein